MFPSILLISNSDQDLDHEIKTICLQLKNPLDPNNPDLLIIKNDHTIQTVRQIKKFLSRKPFSHPNKIVILKKTDLLGIPAQNALLKILEEPGLHNFIVLTTAQKKSLLPTILSRCQIKQIKTAEPISRSLIPFSLKPAANLATATKLKADKNTTIALLNQELAFLQVKLCQQASPDTAQKIKNLIHSISLLKHNVDSQSALDYYLLSS
ncbi:hypothetical protein KJ909_00700 [Patescibacteria group bacterium]|nr:hypothetical protein [Patescibacteria group bacterium]